jgi:hypothetical protein
MHATTNHSMRLPAAHVIALWARLGCLGVACVNFPGTAANVTTVLTGPIAFLALFDRDSAHQPFATATAKSATGRPLAVASGTQKSICHFLPSRVSSSSCCFQATYQLGTLI